MGPETEMLIMLIRRKHLFIHFNSAAAASSLLFAAFLLRMLPQQLNRACPMLLTSGRGQMQCLLRPPRGSINQQYPKGSLLKNLAGLPSRWPGVLCVACFFKRYTVEMCMRKICCMHFRCIAEAKGFSDATTADRSL